MDFKQLEAYVAVVEWKSFSEAAKKMYLTQPTISSHIRTLENELNTTLLIRTTKHLEMTEEGKYLYQEAKKLLRLRTRIYDHFSQNDKGVIRLGASTIPGTYLLPHVLPSFQKKYPVQRFELWQSDSIGVIEQLREGSLDLGLVGTRLNDPSLTFLPFAKDELVIATPATDYYRKLQKENADIFRLIKEPIILRENNSGTRKEAAMFLERLHIDSSALHVVAQMNDQEMIKSSIRNGLGISILSGYSVKKEEKDGSLLVFHLGNYSSYRNLYIVYENNKKLPNYIQQFIHMICNMFHSTP